jgi:hypothetical protein
MRSGNSGTGRGVTEFLKEALALWGEHGRLRVVRADAGFFDTELLMFLDTELLRFLEERKLAYIVVAGLTKYVTRSNADRRLESHGRALCSGRV